MRPARSRYFSRVDDHEPAPAARQQDSLGVANLTFMIQLAALPASGETFDEDFLVDANGLQIFDGKLGGDGAHAAEAATPCSSLRRARWQ